MAKIALLGAHTKDQQMHIHEHGQNFLIGKMRSKLNKVDSTKETKASPWVPSLGDLTSFRVGEQTQQIQWSIDSFPIEMYGSMGLCVYIDPDPVRGLTKMCKSSICLCHSMSLFLFAYGIAAEKSA
ncbi:hypothetical protein Lal_00005777 [Lupinus albus]|nr:hypothetical protein Lal_00005777 [Lupinus albus]